MRETSPEYHRLLWAIASASVIIGDLPRHDIGSEADELKLRSYTLLCHAAIEEYLEKVSLYVLSSCMAMYRSDSLLREPLLCLCAYYSISLPTLSCRTLGPYTVRRALEEIAEEGIRLHRQSIGSVHGIKTKDQNAVLLPIGMRLHDFDPILSQKLNNFGERRGEVAHAFAIKQKTPRAGLESNISLIQRLLLEFDNEICRRVHDCVR